MKKLFYIVLVIVVLLVISKLIKNEAPAPQPTAEAVAVEEMAIAPDSVIEAEGIIVEEPANPDNLSDGEVVDDEVVEEVEEVNPEATAEEDETIIKE